MAIVISDGFEDYIPAPQEQAYVAAIDRVIQYLNGANVGFKPTDVIEAMYLLQQLRAKLNAGQKIVNTLEPTFGTSWTPFVKKGVDTLLKVDFSEIEKKSVGLLGDVYTQAHLPEGKIMLDVPEYVGDLPPGAEPEPTAPMSSVEALGYAIDSLLSDLEGETNEENANKLSLAIDAIDKLADEATNLACSSEERIALAVKTLRDEGLFVPGELTINDLKMAAPLASDCMPTDEQYAAALDFGISTAGTADLVFDTVMMAACKYLEKEGHFSLVKNGVATIWLVPDVTLWPKKTFFKGDLVYSADKEGGHSRLWECIYPTKMPPWLTIDCWVSPKWLTQSQEKVLEYALLKNKPQFNKIRLVLLKPVPKQQKEE